MRFSAMFAITLVTYANAAFADGTPAVREGKGGGGGYSRPSPDDNPDCDKKKLSECRSERAQALENCKFNLVFDCKGHVSVEYSECKAEAGC